MCQNPTQSPKKYLCLLRKRCPTPSKCMYLLLIQSKRRSQSTICSPQAGTRRKNRPRASESPRRQAVPGKGTRTPAVPSGKVVHVPYKVPVPQPYPVEKEIPYPYKVPVHVPKPYPVEKIVPYPVKVHVDKPYPVHIPKPVPYPVEKKIPYPVYKPVPYPVRLGLNDLFRIRWKTGALRGESTCACAVSCDKEGSCASVQPSARPHREESTTHRREASTGTGEGTGTSTGERRAPRAPRELRRRP
ncbi:unnamed protein product [Callosobruchus maculatus]|uniref:Uncharacterized protein n=1 Tax=Callosobruchus maculatus TaxID=64391 RepID=A0A653D032_CALMS|nr:unnamed protein product [Callosobruchus maculatus]